MAKKKTGVKSRYEELIVDTPTKHAFDKTCKS